MNKKSQKPKSKEDYIDRLEKWWRSNKLIAVFVFFCFVIVGLGSVVDGYDKIKAKLFCKDCLFGNSNQQEEKQLCDSSITVFTLLLLPFQPLEECTFKKTNIEKAIISRLEEMNETDSLNLKIIFDTISCIKTTNEAELLGKKLKADLVIWGDIYEHCSPDTSEACLKYVKISSEYSIPGISDGGRTKNEKISSLSEVKEGKLQQNVDYIIYWIAAVESHYQRNFTKALRHYMKIQERGFQSEELYLQMATCYYYLSEFTKAKECYEVFFSKYGGDVIAYNNYGMILAEHGNIFEAKKYFLKALHLDSTFGSPYFNYANTLMNLNGSNDSIKYYFEKAIEIQPNEYFNLNYACFLIDRLNDTLNAKKNFEIALKKFPKDFLCQNNYASFMGEVMEDFEASKKHYEIAISINPNSSWAHTGYGILLYKFKMYKDSRQQLEEALSIDPDFPQANYFMSQVLLFYFDEDIEAKKNYLKATKFESKYKTYFMDSIFGLI